MIDKVLVVLSGGLDSSVATMMCVDKYGKDNVQTVTFDYNQKQKFSMNSLYSNLLILTIAFISNVFYYLQK